MKVVRKWLLLGLGLLVVAAVVTMARARTGQPAIDAYTGATLPPMIAATSIRGLFPH